MKQILNIVCILAKHLHFSNHFPMCRLPANPATAANNTKSKQPALFSATISPSLNH